MGLFVLMLDSTVINVALPDIARDLDATTAGLQWVVNAYLLVLASFVVSAGRLGDIVGRRRVFVLGMAAFAGGSVVAAVSDSEEVLVAGRVLQGIGGAALLGLSLAIVSTVFPADERARALGIWTGVSALALGLGPLVGGALVDAVSWRWLFWLNLPFCLLGVVLVLASTDEQRDETAASPDRHPRRRDRGAGARRDRDRAGRGQGRGGGRRSPPSASSRRASRCWSRSGSSSTASARRSSSSTCFGTGPTSAPAPPASAWSAVTGG